MKQLTIKPLYGDTFRKTIYKDWKRDDTVRQGSWGHGNCVGLWFFGNQFDSLKTKDIKAIIIIIKRNIGGLKKPVNIRLKTHDYKVRPEGFPKFKKKVELMVIEQNGKWITILTDEKDIKKIVESKGLGIDPENYNRNNYAVCEYCEIQVLYK